MSLARTRANVVRCAGYCVQAIAGRPHRWIIGTVHVVSNLPVARTSLIGRDDTLAEIRSIVSQPDTRLLTLTGVGGSGKTRLALRLADELSPRFPNRAWYVELAPVTNADLIPIVTTSALGMREINRADPTAALISFLQATPSLLLIDNCEHLIDASALFVDTLLDSCPDLVIIATSREPLQVPGERQYRVRPLDTPEIVPPPAFDVIEESPAIQLFVSRARDVLPSFTLTPANGEAVASICTRLGGIPLAIELAAAHIHLLGLEEILTRLDDSFSLLNNGARIAPTRHQTLRATIEWSEALLTDVERTIFHRLAVFAGEFQLAAAETVCSDESLKASDVFSGLIGLVNKSLVNSVSDDRAVWFHLLEPVRQYAASVLEQRDDAEMIRARHADAFLALAESSDTELRGPNQEDWLQRVERSQGNFRVALEWSLKHPDPTVPLRMATALVTFWIAHGHLTEGTRWLNQALGCSEDADPSLRMRAYFGAGRMAFHFEDGSDSNFAESESLQLKSIAIARAIADEPGLAWALLELGKVYRLQRKLPLSKETLTDALERFRELGDDLGIALGMLNLGSTLGFLDDPDTSRELLSAAVCALTSLGDHRLAAVAQILLCREERRGGAFAGALRLGIDALRTHARLGDRWFVSFDLMALAEILHDTGTPRDAVTMFAAAQASADRLGSPVGGVTFKPFSEAVDTLRGAGWFESARAKGAVLNTTEAAAIAEEALEQLQHPGSVPTVAVASLSLLTRRELEVARLVAAGQTDRQIADTLFVSTGTVGTHVHHILQKLELRSRVQVADWLAENDDALETAAG